MKVSTEIWPFKVCIVTTDWPIEEYHGYTFALHLCGLGFKSQLKHYHSSKADGFFPGSFVSSTIEDHKILANKLLRAQQNSPELAVQSIKYKIFNFQFKLVSVLKAAYQSD